MVQSILLTSAKKDSEQILRFFKQKDLPFIHAPLEVYISKNNDPAISEALNNLDEVETIIYGHKRNAIFLLRQLNKYNRVEDAGNCLNLAKDGSTFDFLESHGIPAVQSPHGSRPIDMIELMLRLQRLGKTLYPCGSHKSEHFPGLLEELNIPVTELELFDLKGPAEEDLKNFQNDVKAQKPGTVIFHSRRSVTRILAVFPKLDYQRMQVISADTGITKKLKENDISVDVEAEGSWKSVINNL